MASVKARVEIIKDPETGRHIGTIVWPLGSKLCDNLRYYFDPGNERSQISSVPIQYRDICMRILEARGLLQ